MSGFGVQVISIYSFFFIKLEKILSCNNAYILLTPLLLLQSTTSLYQNTIFSITTNVLQFFS
jgi:hypothetical protein